MHCAAALRTTHFPLFALCAHISLRTQSAVRALVIPDVARKRALLDKELARGLGFQMPLHHLRLVFFDGAKICPSQVPLRHSQIPRGKSHLLTGLPSVVLIPHVKTIANLNPNEMPVLPVTELSLTNAQCSIKQSRSDRILAGKCRGLCVCQLIGLKGLRVLIQMRCIAGLVCSVQRVVRAELTSGPRLIATNFELNCRLSRSAATFAVHFVQMILPAPIIADSPGSMTPNWVIFDLKVPILESSLFIPFVRLSRSFQSLLLRDLTSVANAPLSFWWREEVRSCESPSRSMMVIYAGGEFKPDLRPSSPPSERGYFVEKQEVGFGAGVFVFEPILPPSTFSSSSAPGAGACCGGAREETSTALSFIATRAIILGP